MQIASSGGRALTRAAVAARSHALVDGRSVSRRELLQAANDAAQALRLNTRQRIVLEKLVAVWGEAELHHKLLVWPSNEYLMARTGVPERSLRYTLKSLIELELIASKDSANGKRFAIRGAGGAIIDAYGFDLTPLYTRRGDFVAALAEQKAQREAQARLFDAITISRRAAHEALSATRLHYPTVSTAELERAVEELERRTPRRGHMGDISHIVDSWAKLRHDTEEHFYIAACAGKNGRHIETNNEAPIESCQKAFRKKAESARPNDAASPALSVAVVSEACPALADYGLTVRTERDLVAAARFLRGSLGAHESAWNEAVDAIGPIRAAATLLYVLQIHTDDVASGKNQLLNPGGYFRALARRIAERGFDIEVELLAMRRRRMT